VALAVVRGAERTGQRVERIEIVRAADLIAAGDGGDIAHVAFRTPTHFRSGRDHLAHNASERRDYLFPCPERIIADLWRKWTALGWPEVAEPNVNRIGGRIDRYALGQHWAAGRWRYGFTGEISLDLRPLGPDERRAVWVLLRFGCARGVGAHTSYGMGRIELAVEGNGARER
jgi:CRISPR/Cas system endoribonuclease Cas6 (RAMP superfamily)